MHWCWRLSHAVVGYDEFRADMTKYPHRARIAMFRELARGTGIGNLAFNKKRDNKAHMILTKNLCPAAHLCPIQKRDLRRRE